MNKIPVLQKLTIPSVLLLLLMLPYCRKEGIPNLSLPAKTETGQNTLGFMLNDSVWANYGRRCTFYGCHDNTVKANMYRDPSGDFRLSISAGYTVTSKIIDQAFYMYVLNITSAGTYALDSTMERGMTFIASQYTQFYREYRNTVAGKCTLVISRFDTVNNIVSGTFNGVLFNPMLATDSTVITDGRFDAKLDYIK